MQPSTTPTPQAAPSPSPSGALPTPPAQPPEPAARVTQPNVVPAQPLKPPAEAPPKLAGPRRPLLAIGLAVTVAALLIIAAFLALSRTSVAP